MGEKTTVEPNYATSGWESSSPFLGEKTRVEYPLHLGPHRVQIVYTFENQHSGWEKVGMEYFCKRCGAESSIEHPSLYEQTSEHMETARSYMLGYIIEQDCV